MSVRRTEKKSGIQPGAHGLRGLTLIELLVVTAIMGIVIAAIGACLAGGLRVWDAAQNFGSVESQAYFGLREWARDLRNTFPCNCEIAFKGELQTMSFPTMVTGVDDDDPGIVEIGRVEYSFERSEGQLVRRLYRTQGGSERELPPDVCISGIKEMSFSHYYDRAGADLPSPCLTMPFAVDIELVLDNDGEPLVIHRKVVLRSEGLSP